tara:strand:- start:757 stop:903 length:147 start_codon:yes stop_codon:yes gene_type:complete
MPVRRFWHKYLQLVIAVIFCDDFLKIRQLPSQDFDVLRQLVFFHSTSV